MSPDLLKSPATLAVAEIARQQMIDQQVRTWGVLDNRVLETMRSVAREDFVPALYRPVAFAECGIPLGHGQSMLPAKVDGKILEALQLQPADQVLEVGTGSGYLATCLGRMVSHVRSLEYFADLASQAKRNCLTAAANTVAIENCDVFQLTAEQLGERRYDAVAVTGSMAIYDDRFQRALKVGGRLLAFVGAAPVMEAIKITRLSEVEFRRETLFETVVEELINAPQPPKFVF